MFRIFNPMSRVASTMDCWTDAKNLARAIIRTIQTTNGCVSPVSIWRKGVCVAIVTDDANAVTVHKLCKKMCK